MGFLLPWRSRRHAHRYPITSRSLIISTTSNPNKSMLEQIGTWCQQKVGASLDNTFGPDTDIYRIGGKIFAMVNTDDPGFVTLKAPPDEVQALLGQYDCSRPGYYMNKRHWITIDLNGDEPVIELPDLIADSYRLVFSSLSKKRQAEIPGP